MLNLIIELLTIHIFTNQVKKMIKTKFEKIELDIFFVKEPFFSINIPLYNKLSYLNRSFSSIICQDFTNFEIVVIDDFSTDESVNYIRNLSLPNTNIFQHTKNCGILKTRVDGYKASKGDYIVDLDPDDNLICGLLSELYSYLSHEEYDVIEYQYYYRHWSREMKTAPYQKFSKEIQCGHFFSNVSTANLYFMELHSFQNICLISN